MASRSILLLILPKPKAEVNNLPDTDKSGYFMIMEFNHCCFDQLNMSNRSLTTWETDPPFSHKSVVSITHEQKIVCSKTLVLFVGSCLQVAW